MRRAVGDRQFDFYHNNKDITQLPSFYHHFVIIVIAYANREHSPFGINSEEKKEFQQRKERFARHEVDML